MSIINGHNFKLFNKTTYCDVCEKFMWVTPEPVAVRCKTCVQNSSLQCSKRFKKKGLLRKQLKKETTPASPAKVSESNDKTLIKGESVSLQSHVYSSNLVKSGVHNKDAKPTEIASQQPSPKRSPQGQKSRIEIMKRLYSYNSNSPGNFFTMCDDHVAFRGVLRMELNLTRPVTFGDTLPNWTFKGGGRPISSVYDTLRPILNTSFSSNSSTKFSTLKKATIQKKTFRIPYGTKTVLHIRSDTNSSEVVREVMKKFAIIGDPEKYALYQTERKSSGRNFIAQRKKLPSDACPLMIILERSLSKSPVVISFEEDKIENNLYEHFTVPELLNFCKIITKERNMAIDKIKSKYEEYRKVLTEILSTI